MLPGHTFFLTLAPSISSCSRFFQLYAPSSAAAARSVRPAASFSTRRHNRPDTAAPSTHGVLPSTSPAQRQPVRSNSRQSCTAENAKQTVIAFLNQVVWKLLPVVHFLEHKPQGTQSKQNPFRASFTGSQIHFNQISKQDNFLSSPNECF